MQEEPKKPTPAERLREQMLKMRTLDLPELVAVIPSPFDRLSLALHGRAVIPPWLWGKNTRAWRDACIGLNVLARTPAFLDTAIKEYMDGDLNCVELADRPSRLARVRFLVEHSPANLIDFIGLDNYTRLAHYLISWEIQGKCGRRSCSEPECAPQDLIEAATSSALASSFVHSNLRTDEAVADVVHFMFADPGEQAYQVRRAIRTGKRTHDDDLDRDMRRRLDLDDQ